MPEVAFADIEANGGNFPEAAAEMVRRRGCVIVRSMLPKAEAEQRLTELTTYLTTNNVDLNGKALKDIYWSKSQVQHNLSITNYWVHNMS